MSENIMATMKLWHPRGVQVCLPLSLEAPMPTAGWRMLLDSVSAALDAGWLTVQPGLEEGEEKDEVGWVLRGEHEKEGDSTPFVLLYSRNEALSFSFLKVYLNRQDDIAAFEHASKMKLEALPLYVGNDKPQRGASNKTDRFIVAPARAFQVVFKKNPKHDDTEVGKMKPARLFVRWAEQAPAAAEQPAAAPPASVDVALEWADKLATAGGNLQALNGILPGIGALVNGTKRTIWKMVCDHAERNGWAFDPQSKVFVARSNGHAKKGPTQAHGEVVNRIARLRWNEQAEKDFLKQWGATTVFDLSDKNTALAICELERRLGAGAADEDEIAF